MPAITWPPGWQPGYQVQQGTLTGILASDEAGDRCTGVEPTSFAVGARSPNVAGGTVSCWTTYRSTVAMSAFS